MMSTKADAYLFRKNSFWSYLNIFVLISFGLILKMFFARVFSAEEVGIFISSQVAFTFVFFLCGSWLGDASVFFISRSKENKIVGKKTYLKLLKIGFIISSIALILYILYFFLFVEKTYEDNHSKFLLFFLLWSLCIPFRLIGFISASVFQSYDDMKKKVVLYDILPISLVFISIVMFEILGLRNITLVLFAYIFSYVLFSFLSVIYLFKDFFNQGELEFNSAKDVPSTKQIYLYSRPLFLSGIANWPMASIPLVLGLLGNFEMSTYFAFLIAIVSIIQVPASAIEPVIFAKWTPYFKKKSFKNISNDYKKIVPWIVIFSSIPFSVIFLSPTESISLLYGENFSHLDKFLLLLSLLAFCSAFFGPIESIFKASGNTNNIFISRLIEAISLLLIFPLYNYAGFLGVILAYIISSLLGITYLGVLAKMKFQLSPISTLFLKSLFSIIFSMLISFLLNKILNLTGILGLLFLEIVFFLSLMVNLVCLKIIHTDDFFNVLKNPLNFISNIIK